MSTLLNAFLPEKIVIGVQVDVTTGLPDGVVRIAPTLTYNNMSAAETAELLAVFDKLGIEGFNTQDLTAMIADSVNGMLDSMRDYLVLTFEPSKLAEEKKDGKPGYMRTWPTTPSTFFCRRCTACWKKRCSPRTARP